MMDTKPPAGQPPTEPPKNQPTPPIDQSQPTPTLLHETIMEIDCQKEGNEPPAILKRGKSGKLICRLGSTLSALQRVIKNCVANLKKQIEEIAPGADEESPEADAARNRAINAFIKRGGPGAITLQKAFNRASLLQTLCKSCYQEAFGFFDEGDIEIADDGQRCFWSPSVNWGPAAQNLTTLDPPWIYEAAQHLDTMPATAWRQFWRPVDRNLEMVVGDINDDPMAKNFFALIRRYSSSYSAAHPAANEAKTLREFCVQAWDAQRYDVRSDILIEVVKAYLRDKFTAANLWQNFLKIDLGGRAPWKIVAIMKPDDEEDADESDDAGGNETEG